MISPRTRDATYVCGDREVSWRHRDLGSGRAAVLK